MIFDRIIKYVQETRISLSFKRQEAHSWARHQQTAGVRFTTDKLTREIKELLTAIESSAAQRFDAEISSHSDYLVGKQAEQECEHTKLALFTFSYKSKLDELYDSKQVLLNDKRDLFAERDSLSEPLTEAFADKQTAYSELNSAKERVDDWHRKSKRTPWLLGNSGKKMPKHSLFGQSFGDLETYKSHRDSAFQDVNEAKSTIRRIKDSQKAISDRIRSISEKIGDVMNEIGNTKAQRSHMYAFKETGVTVNSIKTVIDRLNVDIRNAKLSISQLKDDRLAHIMQSRIAMGVVEREEEVERIETQKRQFLDEFDKPESKMQRATVHREAWLKERA
jgi:hypothetical protein